MTTDSTISKKEFEKVIKELEDAKLKQAEPLTKGQIKLWYRYLKVLTKKQIWKSVDTIIREDEFFPTISRILFAAGIDRAPAPKALTKEDIDKMSS